MGVGGGEPLVLALAWRAAAWILGPAADQPPSALETCLYVCLAGFFSGCPRYMQRVPCPSPLQPWVTSRTLHGLGAKPRNGGPARGQSLLLRGLRGSRSSEGRPWM